MAWAPVLPAGAEAGEAMEIPGVAGWIGNVGLECDTATIMSAVVWPVASIAG